MTFYFTTFTSPCRHNLQYIFLCLQPCITYANSLFVCCKLTYNNYEFLYTLSHIIPDLFVPWKNRSVDTSPFVRHDVVPWTVSLVTNYVENEKKVSTPGDPETDDLGRILPVFRRCIHWPTGPYGAGVCTCMCICIHVNLIVTSLGMFYVSLCTHDKSTEFMILSTTINTVLEDFTY